MPDQAYRNLCIFHILDGLREGLSHFSQKSRAAVVYAADKNGPVRVYDPQDLLRGTEPALRKFYLESNTWQTGKTPNGELPVLDQAATDSLHLAGLVNYSSRSKTIFHQTLFTEHHADLCSTGPTERWLEHAAWLLSLNFASKNVLYIDTSGNVLQNWATHAVRNYIVDRRSAAIGMDTKLRIYPILDAILSISKTPEEGLWPRGRIVFVEPAHLNKVNFLARLPEIEAPRLEHIKHVRKILQAVEVSSRALISDGQSIVGIATGIMPGSRIVADFRGTHGFLRLGDELVCSFSDGTFHSTNRKANLVQVEEMLLESKLEENVRDGLFRIVSATVHSSQERKHGSTLVLDLNDPPLTLAGMHLSEPLNLELPHLLSLAQSLAKVDGALHIGADRKLHGFGCLLDGPAIAAEDRSRGARFNSALRFTAQNEKLVVVVVSSDRPVSVIQGGMALTATCQLPPLFACVQTPPLLEDWIKG